MKPDAYAFQKRVSYFISPDRPRIRPEQDCESSVELLVQLHVWMQSGPMNRPRVAALDGFARTMNAKVAAAVEEFARAHTADVPEALITKLGFSETELLRLANVNLRLLEWLLSLRWPDGFARPRTLGVYSFTLAIRSWLRQVHIHSAYYKWLQRELSATHRH